MSEALFGLLGVIVGSFIPWIKEALSARRSRAEHATYLAVRVICILDEYIEKCIEVVHDDGTVMGLASHRDKDGSEHYHPVVPLPEDPKFPADVDWKSIDSALMYRILTLPNSVRNTDSHIQWASDEEAWPPYYEEVYEARQKGYAKLGLEAIAIIDHLRATYNLPEKTHATQNADWTPKTVLEGKLKKLEEQKPAVFSPPENIVSSSGKRGQHE
ncbi:hypothetical protein [Magnetovibrio blakemorei]|uniref:Uncharacterized protein n=1 Tax=Magnetovibrio blakemorei TaxID=28181 RepID=A0A1E5Q6V3_9PROT|nr:hypothetical protein [Magnetovibrio blakemorei]OEJ66577.1 hypothetical protein BEN30_12010 [Magnetovibrio blakemorei]